MGVKKVFSTRAAESQEYQDWFAEEIRKEKEAFEVRMNYAKVLVSLWSYASMSDGKLKPQEGNLVGEMTNVLFDDGCVLSDYRNEKAEIIEILSSVFDSPLTIKSIASYTSGNNEMAANFYEDACCIIAAEKDVNQDEIQFLNDLAKELKLSDLDKKTREKKYNIKI